MLSPYFVQGLCSHDGGALPRPLATPEHWVSLWHLEGLRCVFFRFVPMMEQQRGTRISVFINIFLLREGKLVCMTGSAISCQLKGSTIIFPSDHGNIGQRINNSKMD